MQYFAEDFDPQEYESLTDFSGNENVTLMCHNETKKLIIRKTISRINMELYKQLVNVRHRNLVQIMGLKGTELNCYTYEEYINGETLAEILSNGPISEEKAVDWIRQLCEAVRFLHEQSSIIIHRDIKPSNIMLSFDGIIKLIDFDASKEFTPNQQRDTELIGTPYYAAPEQYGFASSDPRTDVYAIGILFHELITGYKPNEINSPYKGRYKKIIQKCIELDPKRRYQSIQELEYQIGMNRVTGFIEKIPGFRTRIWWKQVVAFVVYIIIAVSITGVVLYRYELVVPQIKDRQGLPRDMGKAIGEEQSVVEKQEKDKNVIPKPTDGESQVQDTLRDLPVDNKQPPLDKKGHPMQKLPRIPLSQVNIITSFAGVEMKGATSFDVAIDDWKTWRKGEQGIVYFPRGTAIEITIENNSGQDMINPLLGITFIFCNMDDVKLDIEGLTREKERSFFYRKNKIAIGETVRYRLPLDQAYMNVSTRRQPIMNIMFLADNYLPIQKILVNFKLAGL